MSKLLRISSATRTNCNADVVFVHGLDGDARETWKLGKAFWPEWLSVDLPSTCVWSLDYDAASSHWKGFSMPTVDRARNVLHLFLNHGIGSRPLVFVAHSLGGLLVKQLLRVAKEDPDKHLQSVADHTRLVVFFATPHTGSAIANLVSWLPILWATASVGDLRQHEPAMLDLNYWYRNHSEEMHIETKVYCESRPLKWGFWAGFKVDEASSDPGIRGVKPVPLDANHIDICKFGSREHEAYKGVHRFVRTIADVAVQAQDPTRRISETSVLAPPKVSALRDFLHRQDKEDDGLSGLWELFDWPTENVARIAGMRVSGNLAVVRIGTTQTNYSGIMYHIVTPPDAWQVTGTASNQPAFKAWYEISLNRFGHVFEGTSTMRKKRYLDPMLGPHEDVYKFTGIFTGCSLNNSQGPAKLAGHFENVPSIGKVKFLFSQRVRWSEVSDEVIATIRFELITRKIGKIED